MLGVSIERWKYDDDDGNRKLRNIIKCQEVIRRKDRATISGKVERDMSS